MDLQWIRDILARMESKLDDSNEKWARVDVKLAEQGKDLKYHIHRTDLLELRVEQVEARATAAEKPWKWMRATLKLLSGLAVALGLVATIIRIIQFLQTTGVSP